YALINPNWTFTGSTYFGCQEPHYPLELLFAHDRIQENGHDALVIDAHSDNLSTTEVRQMVRKFSPDFVVIPTAPSYLFWRCPPPELRVPREWLKEVGGTATKVAIGPHASATPGATLQKLNCAVAMRGEPDQTLAQLADCAWKDIEGASWRGENGGLHISS